MTNSRSSKKGAWFALGVAGVALAAALYSVTRTPGKRAETVAEKEQSADDVAKSGKPGFVGVGGVQRPETDLKAQFSDGLKPLADKGAGEFSYGTTPKISGDSNVHTRSVMEALTTGDFPERISPAIAPKAFDRASYKANPDAYLNVVEPGRVYQAAQPSPTTARLQPLTGRLVRIQQGETVPLQVRALPGVPVTFTSFDLGQFHNLLTSVTVKADRFGVATAKFTATPGTINDVHILSASPVTSGQAKFIVNIRLPKPAGTEAVGATNTPPDNSLASAAKSVR